MTATTITNVEIAEPENTKNGRAFICDYLVFAIAEMLGTATILFVGCLGGIGIVQDPYYKFEAITFGLAVALAIQSFGHLSGGHFNPSVTVAAFIMGKIELSAITFYLIAQFLGAIVGYGLILLLLPTNLTNDLCLTVPMESISDLQAVFIEFIATSLLIFACCSVWDYRCAGLDSVSIRFGLTLASVFIATGPFTGASLNPARTLAPSIFQNNWTSHWVYWVGPIGAAVIASLFYKYIFLEGLSRKEAKSK